MLPAISPAVISHLAMPNSGVRRYAAALQSLVSAGARDRLARAEEPMVRRLCALWRDIAIAFRLVGHKRNPSVPDDLHAGDYILRLGAGEPDGNAALLNTGDAVGRVQRADFFGDLGSILSIFGSTSVSPYADEDAAYTTRRTPPSRAARNT